MNVIMVDSRQYLQNKFLVMVMGAETKKGKSQYLRMRVAPLRLMRHMDEHAMSYMRKR